jgi:hypothetical protein
LYLRKAKRFALEGILEGLAALQNYNQSDVQFGQPLVVFIMILVGMRYWLYLLLYFYPFDSIRKSAVTALGRL